MKEKVYINRVNVDYQSIYARAKDYFHRHGIDIDFTFIPCDYKNLTYRIANFPQGQRILLQPTMSQVVSIDLAYDFTSFAFNGMEFPPPNIPTGYCYCPIKQPFIDINLDERTPEANYLLICHEHMHALTFLANQKGYNVPDKMDDYYHNDQPESADSNFGRQWKLLKDFVVSLQIPIGNSPTYKYFSAAEVAKWKLKPELWQALDNARGFSQIPYKITSGFRTIAENTAVGGVDGSEHTLGLGCDILADTSKKRLKIVSGALKAGFTRIGVYLNHVHLGIGKLPSFDQDVLWVINKD